MVGRLLDAGYSVTAYIRNQVTRNEIHSRLPQLQCTETPIQLVAGMDVLVMMVSDGSATQSILFGDDGVAEMLSPNTLVLNMSTIGVEETDEISRKLAEYQVEYIDAPVIGSVKPATEGMLSIVVGGSTDAFHKLRPLFQVLGKHIFHLGDTGAGTKMKLLVNAMLGITAAGLAEVLGIADAANLGRSQVLDVLATSAVWSPMLATKRTLYEHESYPAAFALKHMTKDLILAHSFANQFGTVVPTIEQTSQLYQEANQLGHGDEDMASIIKYLTSLNLGQ